MISIAIIGTSGSKNNMSDFNVGVFDKMLVKTEQLINSLNIPWSNIELWSGGSSGADHVAIILAFKYGCSIKLFLPCQFINGSFYDNGQYSYSLNNGKQLNHLHQKFSAKIGRNTLLEFGSQTMFVFDGFHARNDEIAKANYLIVLTNEDLPTKGGTAYTYRKSLTPYKCVINILL